MNGFNLFQRILIVLGIFLFFFLIASVCIPIMGNAMNPESRQGLILLSLFQNIVMFIIPALICGRIMSRRPFAFLNLNRAPQGMAVLGVVFAYLIALPALNQLIYWNDSVIFPEALTEWGESLRRMEDSARATSLIMLDVTGWGAMLVNLLVIAVLTALGEELFFRGTLQNTLASEGASHMAIWVTAVVFSFMHFQFFGFVPRLILGAWFGYLLYWTRSLYVPMIAHFLNNGVVVVCAWLTARGANADFDMFGVATEGFPTAAFISLIATVIFLVFFKRTFFFGPRSAQRISYV